MSNEIPAAPTLFTEEQLSAMFDETAREALENSSQHEPSPISAEELADQISRLEKEFGPDFQIARMMREELNSMNTGKSTGQMRLAGGDVPDLLNLPFDPAEVADESSLRLTEKVAKRASRRAKPR